MEENTQIPKEVVEQIFQEGQNMLAFAPDNKWSYIQGATAYATKLHQATETIKVLEYDNNKLKGQVEGLQDAVEELKGKREEFLVAKSLLEEVVRQDNLHFNIEHSVIDKIKTFLYGE